MVFDDDKKSEERTFLVTIDFSDCVRDALRQTKLFLAEIPARIIALHVIDHDFITECIRLKLGNESQIKKSCFWKQNQSFGDF